MKTPLNINKFIIILLSAFLFSNIANADVMEEQNVIIKDFFTDTKIVDEWKTPGRYAPVNLFDGDASTCFAVQNIYKNNITDKINLTISLKKLILIDEIRIINGYVKDQKSFDENTRVRKLHLKLSASSKYDKTENTSFEGEIFLKDIMEYQSIKLNKECSIDIVKLYAYPKNEKYSGREAGESQLYYPGSKYEDICLSELEFYYKGKKLSIINSKSLKTVYLKKLHKDIVNAFSNKVYGWGEGGCEPEVIFHKDGRIGYNGGCYGYIPKYPYKWRVINAKLYLNTGKWELSEYWFNQEAILIYDPEYTEDTYGNGIIKSWRYIRKLK